MKAKYPISDEDMLMLLFKYPFLKIEKNSITNECIEDNYYKYWDGTGWEDLWKNRYLPRLFDWYNTLSNDKKEIFQFDQVKEKYGGLRVYTSIDNELEGIVESLSEFVCCKCGKEPRDENGNRVIWRTGGWISNYCYDCALNHINNMKDINIAKIVKSKPFGYTIYKDGKTTDITYKETSDGWLEKQN